MKAPLLLGNTGLVAEREIRERMRGRMFRVGTALILAVVAAAIVIPGLNKGKVRPQRIGVVGGLGAPLRSVIVAAGAAAGASITFVEEPSGLAADADVRSGRITLAVIDGTSVEVKKAASATDTSTTAQTARSVSRALATAAAVAAAGLSPAQAQALATARPLPVRSLEAQPGASSQGTSVVGLILVFVMLTQYNTWTLTGVMEEKASRVVEVLMAAVRPGELLAGKVLGIGVLALGQAAVIVGFAIALASATGSNLLEGTAPGMFAATLVWLVLGYAFYSWVYAAAGSMAERQDQAQTLALPLSIPIIFAYIVSLTAAATGNPSTFVKVLAYLPPTAPLAAPALVGSGRMTAWQFALSAALSVGCTVGVARAASGVYRRAILRTGRRLRLRDLAGTAALITPAGTGAARSRRPTQKATIDRTVRPVG